ncbi:hypothetical protein [Micromonospora craniellae]|uniref:Alpha/beta hydrolase n=1 Tax=Micromonospora craniellae TaxID=2294034 RepID=A0A372G391_9ACTN|nr:hypothetical protein [Micromonospora craniellae]QOC92018.1 hypothetical protein ID554_29845 [Micromonospora craniellae]RFS47517.1 hypothetical protein D0Q02_05925 [Micromonospora craniellae]
MRQRRRAGLLLLTAVSPTIEATFLVAMGFVAATGLSPQTSAVWPYDTYHDLRWLYVYHESWPKFLLWFGAVVVARGIYHTALIMLAWPDEVPRPPVRWLLRRSLGLALLVAVIVAPWALISVAASVVALSWVLLASLLPMFLLAPFLQRAAVVGPWWRGLPSPSLVGWSLLNFVVLTVAGAICWSVPGWWTVPVATAAGVANGLLWDRTVRAALCPSRGRLAWLPATPIAAVLALAVPLLIPPLVQAVPGENLRAEAVVLDHPLPPEVAQAVIVLAGYGSRYGGEAPADDRVERFSYRGLAPDGTPLPYEPRDTTNSVAHSVRLLDEQVQRLHGRTGRPIALIGESEGAMVARTYLRDGAHPAVDSLAMFSPLINAGRAYYPPPHHDRGWGVVTGWQLRIMFGLLHRGGGPGSSPDEPFIRSLVDDAPFYRNQLMCPVPGVRMVAFIPTTTAAEAPPGDYTDIPVFQMPGVHGGLLNRALVEDRLVAFLSGEPIRQERDEYPLLQRLGSAWQAPPLAIEANPAWAAFRQPDPAFTGQVCRPAR